MAVYINPDDFRVSGENLALFVPWAFILVFLIIVKGFLTVVTLGGYLLVTLIVIAFTAFLIRVRQNNFIGQCAKVSEKQFPDIHVIAREAAGRLGMYQPEIFITQNPTLNAYAIGFLSSKSVVLHSATVEGMEREELGFIIGHEFAHIKCKHTELLLFTKPNNPGFVPGWLSYTAAFFFQVWNRKAEYTADRGGLLVTGDPKPAIGGLAKLAVGPTLFKDMDIDDFLGQKMALDQTDFTKVAESFCDHPYLVKRIHALLKFYDSDQYKRLVTREE